MEKSFLNFKAAHPEWTPADPSGSLYLSRIADFSTRTLSDSGAVACSAAPRTRARPPSASCRKARMGSKRRCRIHARA